MSHNHGSMGATTLRSALMDDHNHGDMTQSTDPSGGGSMMHMMQMWFYASESATILFQPWATNSWEEMLGSCIGIFIIAMLYEGLKAGRLWLMVYSNTRTAAVTIYNNGAYMERPEVRQEGSDQGSQAQVIPQSKNGSTGSQSLTWAMKSSNLPFHILQSILHVIQVGIGYMLMLITMTFNAYLFISVVLGCGVGYLVFCYKRPIIVDGNECCH